MRRGCWDALRGTGPRTTGAGARFFGACEGQALALRVSGFVFFVVRGPSRLYPRDAGFPASPPLPPQSLLHPVNPANPGHPASDAINIKVLTDLFSLLRRRSIDIQVRWTCSRVLVAAVVRGPVPRARSAV